MRQYSRQYQAKKNRSLTQASGSHVKLHSTYVFKSHSIFSPAIICCASNAVLHVIWIEKWMASPKHMTKEKKWISQINKKHCSDKSTFVLDWFMTIDIEHFCHWIENLVRQYDASTWTGTIYACYELFIILGS